MWPWQRNGEQPNHVLVRRLLILSSMGHACLLMLLFVFYHDATNVSRDVIAVLLDTEVTIVKVPLTKIMHKTAPVVGTDKKATISAPAKKEAPPSTGLSKPKEQPKVAIVKAKKVSKPKVEPKPKKELVKPKAIEAPKIVRVEPKKIEEKKPEPEKPAEQATLAQITDQALLNEPVMGDNVVYVGQHEYDALEVQHQIQQEAQRCWKAPPGIAPDVACQVVVRIDHVGHVREVVIAKESGILMYDVRARQAISQMEFPRGSWGKEVVVYFKQS